jgi:rubrerythrin
MYPEFAQTADEEDFAEIAKVFRNIAIAERRHEERYRALAKNIAKDRVFKREQSVKWVCRNCGYVYEGMEPPETCPSCAHPKNYFELEKINY